MNRFSPTGASFPPQRKQSLEQQSSLEASQPHIMPAPTASPWSLDSMPWQLATTTQPTGAVMQFTANSAKTDEFGFNRTRIFQKRKSDLNSPLPSKQFITEEKITAYFDGLSITDNETFGNIHSNIFDENLNNNPNTSNNCYISNGGLNEYKLTAKELEEKLKNAQRITMCQEAIMFQEQQKKSSFLPEVLLNRVEKPCTALVLWKPPPAIDILKQYTKSTISKNDKASASNDTMEGIDVDDIETEEIDDFVDNNNSCNFDFNNIGDDQMDEDL